MIQDFTMCCCDSDPTDCCCPVHKTHANKVDSESQNLVCESNQEKLGDSIIHSDCRTSSFECCK